MSDSIKMGLSFVIFINIIIGGMIYSLSDGSVLAMFAAWGNLASAVVNSLYFIDCK